MGSIAMTRKLKFICLFYVVNLKKNDAINNENFLAPGQEKACLMIQILYNYSFEMLKKDKS